MAPHMTNRGGNIRRAVSPKKPLELDQGHLAVNIISLYGIRGRAGRPPNGRWRS